LRLIGLVVGWRCDVKHIAVVWKRYFLKTKIHLSLISSRVFLVFFRATGSSIGILALCTVLYDKVIHA